MKKILQFFKECGGELRKVVWPSRDNVVASVKVVLVSTLIIAAVLGVLDVLFTSAMRLVF